MNKKIALSMLSIVVAASTSAFATPPKPAYGQNILRFTPVTIFNENVGGGISYERILDKDGKIGLNIPVYFGVSSYDNYYNGSNYNNINNYSVFINPGIKFYPAGQRKVTYAIGASLFTMMGDDDYYNSNGGPTYRVNASYMKAGIMVNNYLNFNISPKFNIGLEVGIGPSYLNQYTENNYRTTEGIEVAGQFGFHLGYRF